ncbi:MAG: DUF3820 family protein [Spirochaetaceae bacterium]|nr:DUF3820 family protein [Spirochaetaceae bacterium]
MKHYNVNTGSVSGSVDKPAPSQKDLMPFGKYKGIDIVDIPSSYLRWCCLQDWFEKYRGLLKAIDEELKFRDKRGCHFEEDGGRRG